MVAIIFVVLDIIYLSIGCKVMFDMAQALEEVEENEEFIKELECYSNGFKLSKKFIKIVFNFIILGSWILWPMITLAVRRLIKDNE